MKELKTFLMTLAALALGAIAADRVSAGGYRYYYPRCSTSYCTPRYSYSYASPKVIYAPPVVKTQYVKEYVPTPVSYNYNQTPVLFNFITNAPAPQPLNNPATQYGYSSSFASAITFNPDLLANTIERSLQTTQALGSAYQDVAAQVLQSQALHNQSSAEVQKAALAVEAIRAAAQGVNAAGASYSQGPDVYQYDAVKGNLRHIAPSQSYSDPAPTTGGPPSGPIHNGPSRQPLPPDPGRNPDPAPPTGAAMLVQKCYKCHGPTATGKGAKKFKFDLEALDCNSYARMNIEVKSGRMPPEEETALSQQEGIQILKELDEYVQLEPQP